MFILFDYHANLVRPGKMFNVALTLGRHSSQFERAFSVYKYA